ncbi:phytoene synthase 1, chloroplastic-like [Pistacia vera]|uniref:phytoene synthase 1, chloroplastic-like n=1 Tax=Pistacia vera TaxID=55513 RepID=UPI0012634F95|nr:phytoene synthase 1, chloroplastic-like [Pistacia vera]
MIEGMRTDLKSQDIKPLMNYTVYCYMLRDGRFDDVFRLWALHLNHRQQQESVYNAALALGIANQLTNILRTLERKREGFIYHKMSWPSRAFLMKTTSWKGDRKWRNFMKNQLREQGCSLMRQRNVTELSMGIVAVVS